MRDEQSYRPDGADRHVSAPPKFQAIGILLTVSGSLNLLAALSWLLFSGLAGFASFGIGFVLCIVPVFLGVVGGMELFHGIAHLNNKPGLTVPRGLAILEICSIVSCSVSALIAGIIILIFSREPEVQAHYAHLAAQ